MKQYPIIFNTNMVEAILDGRKTQTRRVIKNKNNICPLCWVNAIPHNVEVSVFQDIESGHTVPYLKPVFCEHNDTTSGRIFCPYGQVGDQLWVRETYNIQSGDFPLYKADCSVGFAQNFKWYPSIFMPRWASRITLEIAEVRVERVQDITDEDAKAEGCSLMVGVTSGGGMGLASPRYAFKELWDSLNAKRGFGWEVNPWVWVISFRVI